MVALNAAAAFIGAGLAADFAAGVALAKEVIGSGKAMGKLDALIAKSKSFGPQS
jgi:anthranilate phosphoribosyltransferase